MVINNVLGNFGVNQYLASGYTPTDDARPVFSGRGPVGEIITLYRGEQILGSVRADGFGRWEMEITEDLQSGSNPVVARSDSQQSNMFNVIVALPADVPLTINHAKDNHGQYKTVINNGTTDDTRPTFSGYAGVGETVTLYIGEEVIGSVQADRYGNWNLEKSDELLIGDYTVTAKTATQQSNSFTFTVESAADQPIAISSAYVLIDGSYKAYLTSGKGYTGETRPTFTGTAGIGEIVVLSDGNTILGSTTTGLDGVWSLEITSDLTSGINNVTAKTATQQSNTFVINVELAADKPVTIEYAYDNVGLQQYIYDYSRGTTDDTRPTFYGTAGAKQLVTLYSGSVVLGSVQAGSDGKWSLEITEDLRSGRNNIIAKTETRESSAFKVYVETPADMPEAILSAWDNFDVNKTFYSGSWTDNVRPTFTGIAGINMLVTLYKGDIPLGSVRAD